MNRQKFRKLSEEEIRRLVMQGCICDDWNRVEVVENFLPDRLSNVKFLGFNRLGCFDGDVILFNGVRLKTGIFNATIYNCTIENNALINNIRSKISNCRIGERVVLLNNEPGRKGMNVNDGHEIWMISGIPYKE